MIFVDTNFFLRFLLRDIKPQYLEAKELFLSAAQGKIKLITTTMVFFELYWVLQSSYKNNKSQLSAILIKILAMNFIILEERSLLVESLNLFKNTSLSLEDCYNLAYAREKDVKSFKTFDTQLSKIFEEN